MVEPFKNPRGRWVAPVRHPTTFKWTTVTVDSKDEAKRRIRASEEAYDQARHGSKPRTVHASSKSYLEWLDDKYNTKSNPRQKRASVPRDVALYIRNVIDPYFKGVATRDVSLSDLHEFMAHLIDPAGADLSLRTGKGVLAMLRQIFGHAKRNGVITINPFDEYRRSETAAFLATHRPKRPVAMDLGQIRLLLATSKGVDRLIVYIMLLAGLRSGELTALRWRHVDFVLGGLWIFESGYGFSKATESEIVAAGPTKTPAGCRFIPWGPALENVMLEAWNTRTSLRPDTHVVLNTQGRPYSYEGLSYRLAATQSDALGLPRRKYRRRGADNVNNHNFRHTAAALWITAGIHFQHVARWMGHAHRSTTISAYGHFLVDPDVPAF